MVTYVVSQSHPRAADTNPGTEAEPLRTISAAARQAGPGDTVLVHEGIYRERVIPARGGEEGKPITYQAAQGEKVFVRGSDVFTGTWESVAGHKGVFIGRIDPAMVAQFNPFGTGVRSLPSHRTLGQVIVNGQVFFEAESVEGVYNSPGLWRAGNNGDRVTVNFGKTDPTKALVELTVRSRIFAPLQKGLGYITVRGFVFEHCANQSAGGFWNPPNTQAGAFSCRSGHHWVIEDNIIRWAKSIGIDVGRMGREDSGDDGPDVPRDQIGHHLIQRNIISDNGECGICGLGHRGVQVLNNVIERNNNLAYGAVEEGGLKFHGTRDTLIEGNLVRDNQAVGIWLDTSNKDARVTRNLCLNNRGSGIFTEITVDYVLVDNNIVAMTRPEFYPPDSKGDGFYTHDAANTTFVHNLSYKNAQFGYMMRIVSNRRLRGRMNSVFDMVLLNNLALANPGGEINIPYNGPRAWNNTSDYNYFVPGAFPPDATAAEYGPERRTGGRFVATTSAGTPMETIQEAFTKAFPNDVFKPVIDREVHRGVTWAMLSLEQWRGLMGFDQHSKTGTLGEHQLDPETFSIVLEVDDAFWQMDCQPFEGMDNDYFGNPIPKKNPLPGPFQNLKKGRNKMILWPRNEESPTPTPAPPDWGIEDADLNPYTDGHI